MFTPEQLEQLKKELLNICVYDEVTYGHVYVEAVRYQRAFQAVFKREPSKKELRELRHRFPKGEELL